MPRTYGFSADFDILWRALAAGAAASPSERTQLSKEVLKLSDHFIKEAGLRTPWISPLAYELYFHPLNYLRARRAIAKAHQAGFFEGLTHFIDWGAGAGAFSRALWDELPPELTQKISVVAVDQSSKALERYKHWSRGTFKNLHHIRPEQFSEKLHLASPESSCLAMSYSLNEMDSPPLPFEDAPGALEATFLLEPSTHKLARRLQAFRGELLKSGYQAFAPCPHQQSCPLLTESPKTWCHDRLHTELPELWQQLFGSLPIHNKTLTLSYLAARKTTPAPLKGAARLVGDELKEKGRTRWTACAGPKAATLNWLSRWGEAPAWKRGDLLLLPEELQNELAGGGPHRVEPELLARIKNLP